MTTMERMETYVSEYNEVQREIQRLNGVSLMLSGKIQLLEELAREEAERDAAKKESVEAPKEESE